MVFNLGFFGYCVIGDCFGYLVCLCCYLMNESRLNMGVYVVGVFIFVYMCICFIQ